MIILCLIMKYSYNIIKCCYNLITLGYKVWLKPNHYVYNVWLIHNHVWL